MPQQQLCKSLFSTILHIMQWYTYGSETSGDVHVGVAKFREINCAFVCMTFSAFWYLSLGVIVWSMIYNSGLPWSYFMFNFLINLFHIVVFVVVFLDKYTHIMRLHFHCNCQIISMLINK